jgi:aminodeoxyfutalosine deaminase
VDVSGFAEQAVAYRARWVIPVDRPPIEGGVVTIAGRRVVSVADAAEGPVRDLGDVALLPGLVNAHTHLEFSLLAQPLGQAKMPFADWLQLVVEHRRQEAKALMVETDGFQRFRRRAASAGLHELTESGTVAVGDIETAGWPRQCFPADGLHATIFLELLGLDPQQEDSLISMGHSFVLDLQDMSSRVRPGLSPHAPYTVSPALIERTRQLSRSERFPVAMHLAESREELELLASHTGRLVEVLQALNAWHPRAVPRGARPMDYLRLLAGAHRALVIHGNYLVDDEMAFASEHRERLSVVYCPRTHSYFGHEPYPLAQMLDKGVRMAVGTDSRGSNPDLKLLEELRHVARQHPTIPPENILKMGTLWGAEALGLAEKFGSITPGKTGRLVVVPCGSQAASPYEFLFTSSGSARPLAQFAA